MRNAYDFSKGYKKTWPGGRRKAPNLLKYLVPDLGGENGVVDVGNDVNAGNDTGGAEVTTSPIKSTGSSMAI